MPWSQRHASTTIDDPKQVSALELAGEILQHLNPHRREALLPLARIAVTAPARGWSAMPSRQHPF